MILVRVEVLIDAGQYEEVRRDGTDPEEVARAIVADLIDTCIGRDTDGATITGTEQLTDQDVERWRESARGAV